MEPIASSPLNRRQILRTAGAAAAALGAPGLVFSQAGSPVKIGSLLPRQGPFALQGEATSLGIKVALEQAGNKVLGRPSSWSPTTSPTRWARSRTCRS